MRTIITNAPDYDLWLQKSAGCFDEYPEHNPEDDEIFDYFESEYGDNLKSEVTDLSYRGIRSIYAEHIIEIMWDDPEVLKELEDGTVEDLAEWMKKHPEKVDDLFERCRPYDADEFKILLGKETWNKLSEEYDEYYWNHYDPDDDSYRDWD